MGERALPTGMLAAARDGDVECLLTFLDDGVSANAGNVIGQTAMHIASIWGHVDVVDALLDAGANPNQENDDGLPPLYFAVRNNRLSVVRLLLDRGAVIRDLDRLLKVSEEEVAAVLMRSGPRNELTQAIKALDLDKLKEQRRWRAPRRRSQSAETLPGALRGRSCWMRARSSRTRAGRTRAAGRRCTTRASRPSPSPTSERTRARRTRTATERRPGGAARRSCLQRATVSYS